MLRGGQLSRRASIFSGDGRLLVVPCAHEVRAYSVATGEQMASLEGHSGEVTSLALCPGEDLQVYSASFDGTLRHWDLSSRKCLSVVHVHEAVQHMAVHAGLRLAFLSIDWRDGSSGRVISWHLDRGRAGASALKTRAAGPLTMNPRGSLAATIDRHSLFVWRVGHEISQPLNLTHTKPYTCLALSADDAVLAAGDTSGRILIWRNVADALQQQAHAARGGGGGPLPQQPSLGCPPCTTVHWHSAPVGCLSFSPDSVYLRSGGKEAVLVSWHLETLKTSFLPRLGGALLGLAHCAAHPSQLLLRQADNTLRVINLGTNEVSVSVLGLRPPLPQLGSQGSMPATCLQPGTGLLLAPTHNAMLQLFDVARDRHVALLQAAPRNDVSTVPGGATAAQDAAGAQAVPHAQQPQDKAVTRPGVFVSHAAFTYDGTGLVTAIVRPDPGSLSGTGVETSLRFWDVLSSAQWQAQQQQPFSLNTLADDPHTGYPVACVASHPWRAVVVTAAGLTGPAGAIVGVQVPTLAVPEFKVWERLLLLHRPSQQQQQQHRKGSAPQPQTCWGCRSVGSYKGMPFTAAAFSGDGSLLALAAGPAKVTLWDALSCALVAVLPTAPELVTPPPGLARGVAGPAVNTLAFLQGAPFLVGCSGNALAVWDLLSASLHWALPLAGIESLAADPLRPHFAVAVPGWTPNAPWRIVQAQQRNKPKQQHHPGRRAGGNDAAGATAPAAAALQDSKPLQVVAGGGEPADGKAELALPPPVRGGACCHVLRFGPESQLPAQACSVPGTRSVQLLYSPASAAMDDGGGGEALLLLLTAERMFVHLGGRQPGDRAAVGAGAAEAAKGAGLSPFEAAFGALAPTPAAMEVEAEQGGVPVGGEAALRHLLDAPSHLLPPPSMLASEFLQLLTQPAQ